MTTYYKTKKCSAYYIEVLQRVKRIGLIFKIGSSDVLIEPGFENMFENTTTIKYTKVQTIVQRGARNDPTFDIVLIFPVIKYYCVLY